MQYRQKKSWVKTRMKKMRQEQEVIKETRVETYKQSMIERNRIITGINEVSENLDKRNFRYSRKSQEASSQIPKQNLSQSKNKLQEILAAKHWEGYIKELEQQG